MTFNSETGSAREYFERLRDRHCDPGGSSVVQCCVWKMIRSADRHLARFDLSARRYYQALDSEDQPAAAAERDIMLALLYEAADTVFIVIQMIDFDRFRLFASGDGAGLTGEDAPFVAQVLDALDAVCARVLDYAGTYDLSLTFGRAVDERHHATYESHAHWQNFVPGSVEKSFFAYFSRAKQSVNDRLNQVPKFWQRQTLKQALMKSPRTALRALVQRLLLASFPAIPLAARIEKEYTPSLQRHWEHGPDRSESEDAILGVD